MSAGSPSHPNADVRMRGFVSRSTVEAAWAWLDTALAAYAPAMEDVGLFDAGGRVLARDVTSVVDVPGFARSMMDGYAVRAEETYGANAYNPLPLSIVGVSFPGVPCARSVNRGEAVRIMTGAPLPSGTDAVIPVEHCDADEHQVRVLDQVSIGKHVGQIGEDIRRGDIVRTTGSMLRPQDLGVMSSIGIATVPVRRQPRVRIVITGNELLPAGTTPQGYQIADANSPMLAALIQHDGGIPLRSDIVRDDPAAITAALETDAEVILVSGGSSVGQEDYVPKLLAERGELAIHGVAMRPSSPAGMGRLGERLVFLLPGNPVSCLCAYDFFAGRAIRVLGGRSPAWPYPRRAVPLVRKLVSTVGRVDYARVRLTPEGAEPLAISGAAILSSTTRADGFVIVPADSEGFPPGAIVDVFLYQ